MHGRVNRTIERSKSTKIKIKPVMYIFSRHQHCDTTTKEENLENKEIILSVIIAWYNFFRGNLQYLERGGEIG